MALLRRIPTGRRHHHPLYYSALAIAVYATLNFLFRLAESLLKVHSSPFLRKNVEIRGKGEKQKCGLGEEFLNRNIVANNRTKYFCMLESWFVTQQCYVRLVMHLLKFIPRLKHTKNSCHIKKNSYPSSPFPYHSHKLTC